MNIDLKNFSKNVNEYIKIQNDTYQDILWIDDIDTQQAQMQGNEILFKNTWFPNHWEKINILDRMDLSYDEIVTNCDKYNLVIFDMNMENDNGDDDYQSLKDNFSKYDISLPEDDTSEDKNGNNFWTTAGIYLYLLLLTKGYPADRMLIYTANSNTLKDSLRIICPALDLKIIKKDKNKKIDLEQYYDKEKNGYYRIRRLVLQACGYWKKEITDKKDENIPFNRIYFSKDTDQKISKENFEELLERVEMMFPVIQPASPEKVYYQAARILCEYHEESTKIQDIDQYIYPFHAVCRNFRNWSSHNKFHKAEMPADIFALLFCITLRTYFDFLVYYDKGKKEKISKFEKGYCAYEDVYNFKQSNNQKNDINLFGIIKSKLIKGSSLPLVLNRKTWKKSIPYSELVWLWGEDKNNRAHIHYILFPLVMKDYSMQFTAKPNNMKLNALSGENNLLNDDITDYCTYTDTGFMESAYKESCRICYENKDKE